VVYEPTAPFLRKRQDISGRLSYILLLNTRVTVVWPQIRERQFNEENSLSISKRMHIAQPCRVKLRLQVQVPTAVNGLTLSVYNIFTCYKFSDDGVGKIRFVVSTRRLRTPTEKEVHVGL